MQPDEDRGEANAASSFLTRLVTWLSRVGGAVSAVLVVLVLGIVTYAIFQRYVMQTPLLWGDELIGYLLVAIVMFGAADALRGNNHISIDLLTRRAGPKLAHLLRIWFDLAVFGFALILGWSTWQTIEFAYQFGSYSPGYIEIATWVPQVPMLIGSVLLALVALTRLIATIGRGTAQ